MKRAFWLLVGALFLWSCGAAEKAVEADAGTEASTAEFCPHGIQTAVCSQCNPSLMAVFRAKGTLCEEHGFPEEVCPVCHPEKKGQRVFSLGAPAPEKDEKAPPEGMRLRLATPEMASLAGLQLAEVRSDEQGATLSTSAVIVYDAARYAQVNARASGVVRALLVEVGAQVTSKDALARVQSAEIGAERSRKKGAAAALALAEEEYRRVEESHSLGVAAKKDLSTAKIALEAARAAYEESAAALGEIDSSTGAAGGYAVASPIAGVVVKRHISLGQSVAVGESLFDVADPSTMWAEVAIPEADIAQVSAGQTVALRVDSLPGREFRGVLSYLAPEIDRKTRVSLGRVSLPNPDGALRANMFARAWVLSPEEKALGVPSEAIQRIGGVSLVFVKVADELFEVRRVEPLGSEGEDGWVRVRGLLTPGEKVVSQGSFLLKTEVLKDSIGAGCCVEE